MPHLITPAFRIPFEELYDSTKSIPGDDFTQKIIEIIRKWNAPGAEFNMHTSGSTGVPKEIKLDREAMKASALSSARAFGLKSGDIFLCCLSPEHIAGFMMVIRALVIGADLVAIAPESNPLVELPADIKIDFAAVVPLQLQAILEAGMAGRLNAMKAIIVGGAPLAEQLAKQVKEEIFAPVYQTYSMTETYTHVALRKLNGPDASAIYYALEGIHFSLDERDCLVIHAPELKVDNLITNDLVELLDATHFRWLGRIDNVINSGGIKIQLEKIERKAEEILADLGKPGLSLFAAGKEDYTLGQRLILIIENKNWPSQLLENFKRLLSESLPKYEVPKEIFFTEKFERTKLGKIDRIGTMKRLGV